MSQMLRRALLVCASLLVGVLVAEGFIAAFVPQDLSGWWMVESDQGLTVNKSSGRATHQHGDRVVEYRFAAPHLRAPAPDGAVRVLVVGDSFAFGWLLDDGSTVVGRLQARVNDTFGEGAFALLNAATPGWGTADYAAFVEDFGGAIRPDIVLVLLNADDIGRIPNTDVWNFSGADALARAPGRRSPLKGFVNALPGYGWLLEHSHAVQLQRRAVAFPPEAEAVTRPYDEATARDTARLGVRLFQRLAEWCRRRSTTLMVTTTGWHRPPYTDASDPTEVFMAGAPALFAELGVPYQDPSPMLLQRMAGDVTPYVIPGDDHPNEQGALVTAEALFPFIESELADYCQQSNRCRADRRSRRD